MISEEGQIELFKKRFDISLQIESIELEIYEDDGYGNSHHKGVLQLKQMGLYGRWEFDIKRVDRKAIKPSLKIFDREVPYHDYTEDTRGNGIREENNILQSIMLYYFQGIHRTNPFFPHKNELPLPWWKKLLK